MMVERQGPTSVDCEQDETRRPRLQPREVGLAEHTTLSIVTVVGILQLLAPRAPHVPRRRERPNLVAARNEWLQGHC